MDTIDQTAYRGTQVSCRCVPSQRHVVKDHEIDVSSNLLGIPLVRPGANAPTAPISAAQSSSATRFRAERRWCAGVLQFADPDVRTHSGEIAAQGSALPHRAQGRRPSYDELRRACGFGVPRDRSRLLQSIYELPDGMILDACDPPDVAKIDAMRRADAHSELRAGWAIAGSL